MKKVFFASTSIGIALWLIARNRKRASLSPSWSTRQRVGGALDQIQGATKRTAGNVIGDSALAAEGMVQEAVGAVRRGTGKAAASVSNVLGS